MKKILLIITIALLFTPTAQARLIKVSAESDFTTENPPSVWSVKLVEDVTLKSGQIIKNGSVFEGEITDVVSPKRLKRDASFTFVPRTFYDTDGSRYNINYKVEAKYNFASNIKTKDVVKQGVLTAGNLVIPGIGSAVQVAEGIYKNEEGNRLKSGATAAIDSTPISYYKYGKEIEFKKGDIFKMNFVLEDEEQPVEQNPNGIHAYNYAPVSNTENKE